MSEELVDRKPTLRFNYQGFSVGEQNKVEDTTSSVKQRKLYNCIYKAKKPQKFVRLPVHLACKTCPRGQVDCYIELTPEYPKGDLHKRCAICMSSHCGFTKMDQYVRAELRTWLDAELARRKITGRVDDSQGTEDIDGIAEIDGSAMAAIRGGKRKRARALYVESSDEDDDDDHALPTRNRGKATTFATTSTSLTASSRKSAEDSDLVQQVVRLVASSQTFQQQLADKQKELDDANQAQVDAEAKLKDMEENSRKQQDGKAAELEAKNRELEETLRSTQAEMCALEIKNIEMQDKLEEQTEAARKQSESAANKAKEERDGVVRDLRRVGKEAAKVPVLETELEKAKADHTKAAEQLVKWKATLAALQGL